MLKKNIICLTLLITLAAGITGCSTLSGAVDVVMWLPRNFTKIAKNTWDASGGKIYSAIFDKANAWQDDLVLTPRRRPINNPLGNENYIPSTTNSQYPSYPAEPPRGAYADYGGGYQMPNNPDPYNQNNADGLPPYPTGQRYIRVYENMSSEYDLYGQPIEKVYEPVDLEVYMETPQYRQNQTPDNKKTMFPIEKYSPKTTNNQGDKMFPLKEYSPKSSVIVQNMDEFPNLGNVPKRPEKFMHKKEINSKIDNLIKELDASQSNTTKQQTTSHTTQIETEKKLGVFDADAVAIGANNDYKVPDLEGVGENIEKVELPKEEPGSKHSTTDIDNIIITQNKTIANQKLEVEKKQRFQNIVQQYLKDREAKKQAKSQARNKELKKSATKPVAKKVALPTPKPKSVPIPVAPKIKPAAIIAMQTHNKDKQGQHPPPSVIIEQPERSILPVYRRSKSSVITGVLPRSRYADRY